jgi:hypothetical protein
MDEKLKNLSLNNTDNNFNNIVPGSTIKIKNKENEYIVLGYDQYRTNLVCVDYNDYNDKYQTDKFYLVDNSNLESVTKYNELPKLTRFVYE